MRRWEIEQPKRWLNLGEFRILVAAPAILMAMIYLAAHLARHEARIRSRPLSFMQSLLLTGAAVALLSLQPYGTAALLLSAITLVLLLSAGARLWQLTVMLVLLWLTWLIVTALMPWGDHAIYSAATCFPGWWQDLYNSRFALSQQPIFVDWSAWLGAGLGAGAWAPDAAKSDFMASLMGQQLGLLGLGGVIILYSVLIWRTVAISRQARRAGNRFAALLLRGIGLWIGLQAGMHIAENFRLVGPAQGWNWPLLSAGGTNLIVSSVAIALVLRVEIETGPALDADPEPTDSHSVRPA